MTPNPTGQDNYVICPKCNKRGFLAKRVNKPKIQIPDRGKIFTIIEALDYAAKCYYRLYERNLFIETTLPENGTEIFNSNEHLRTVWFSPHSSAQVKDFATEILHKVRDQKISRKKRKTVEKVTNPNRSTLDRLEREIGAASRPETINGISILYLFFSISFIALRRYYEDIAFLQKFFNKYQLDGTSERFPSNDQEVLIAKCLLYKPSLFAYVKDDRNNRSLQKWMTILQDTVDYGVSGSASRNKTMSYFCNTCMAKWNRVSIIEPNEVCPVCNGAKRINLRPSENQIEKVREDFVYHILEFEEGYAVFLRWGSLLSEVMNGTDGLGLTYYQTYFDYFKEQFKNNNYSFLKEPRYLIGHKRDRSGKRLDCYLNDNDFDQMIISNKQYDKMIDDLARHLIFLRITPFIMTIVSRLRELLMQINYPVGRANKKIETDLNYVLGVKYRQYQLSSSFPSEF